MNCMFCHNDAIKIVFTVHNVEAEAHEDGGDDLTNIGNVLIHELLAKQGKLFHCHLEGKCYLHCLEINQLRSRAPWSDGNMIS